MRSNLQYILLFCFVFQNLAIFPDTSQMQKLSNSPLVQNLNKNTQIDVQLQFSSQPNFNSNQQQQQSPQPQQCELPTQCQFGTYSYDEWKQCDSLVYQRTDFYQSQGSAYNSTKSNLGILIFSASALNKNASQSYTSAYQIIKKTINQINQQFGQQKGSIVFSIQQTSLQPHYESQMVDGVWIQVFNGYQTSINLMVKTEQMSNLGSFIDIGVQQGMLLNSVSFSLKPEDLKQIQYSLIGAAIQDAEQRASLVAQAMNVQIAGIKGLYFYDNIIIQPREQAYKYMANNEATQVFASQSKTTQTATISYIFKEIS